MMLKRFCTYLIGAMIAICLAGCQAAAGPLDSSPQQKPESTAIAERVHSLLRQEAADSLNWELRGATGTHLFGDGAFRSAHPVNYAAEKVLVLGRDAVDPLLSVVSDPHQDQKVRDAAWDVLANLDDPRIRPELLRQLKAKRVAYLEARHVLGIHLPLDEAALNYPPPADPAPLIRWLEEQSNKSFEELCLSLMDDVMNNPKASDEYSIRDMGDGKWLNRYCDRDLDEWLKRVAPDALAFRDRELARGYDPAFALERLYSGNLTFDEDVKTVFSERRDQLAFLELMRVQDVTLDGPLQIPFKERMASRGSIRAWYLEHRDHLKYDWDKHRFVIQA